MFSKVTLLDPRCSSVDFLTQFTSRTRKVEYNYDTMQGLTNYLERSNPVFYSSSYDVLFTSYRVVLVIGGPNKVHSRRRVAPGKRYTREMAGVPDPPINLSPQWPKFATRSRPFTR